MDVGDVRFGGIALPYDDIKFCKVAFCVVARAERMSMECLWGLKAF